MPTRVYPVGRPTDILLVAPDWRLRAPLYAQLREDGYDVTALESWDEAELLLGSRALAPRVLIVDVYEETNPEALLRTLAALAGGRRVLILTAPSTLSVEAVRALGFDAVLARPFRIADVEQIVASWLPGHEPPPR